MYATKKAPPIFAYAITFLSAKSLYVCIFCLHIHCSTAVKRIVTFQRAAVLCSHLGYVHLSVGRRQIRHIFFVGKTHNGVSHHLVASQDFHHFAVKFLFLAKSVVVINLFFDATAIFFAEFRRVHSRSRGNLPFLLKALFCTFPKAVFHAFPGTSRVLLKCRHMFLLFLLRHVACVVANGADRDKIRQILQ